MKNLEEIKTDLRTIQGNFNPVKETYKIIDEVVNASLTEEEMFKKLSEIKGTNRYPEAIKNRYDNIMNDLQKLVIDSKKLEEKKRQEENTRELKDIIESLEKSKVGKKKLEEEEEVKDVEPQEGISSTSFNDDSNLNRSIVDEDTSEIVDKPLSLNDDCKEEKSGKKLFLFLLIMVILSIVVGILIFLFF